MPARSTPLPKGSFCPPNDTATYRDLLLFEERLKSNAASLQRRKSRYQLFLFQLLVTIALLLLEVLLPPKSSFLASLYKLALQRLLPDIYTPETNVTLHPYFASGLLFVSVTTLVLFFASGMYSEKIAYANKYVPHANRALRSFNMYLNVRKPPLRSKVYFNPLSFFFPRPDESAATAASTPSSCPPPSLGSAPSLSRSRSRSGSTSLPIPSIPPATNPRGELIFSSRVDRNFREAYERYRALFERRRAEKERLEKHNRWPGKLAFWDRGSGASAVIGAGANVPTRTVSSSSSRGRGGGSRSGTPPMMPGRDGSGGVTMKQRERSGSPMRQGQGSGSSTSGRGRTRDGTPPSSGMGRQGGVDQRERGRKDEGDDGNMRTTALERSWSQGSSQK